MVNKVEFLFLIEISNSKKRNDMVQKAVLKRKMKEQEANSTQGRSSTFFEIEEKILEQDSFVVLGPNGSLRLTCDLRGCALPAFGPIGPECASSTRVNLVGCQTHSRMYTCICGYEVEKTNYYETWGYKLVARENFNGSCIKYSGDKRITFTRYIWSNENTTNKAKGKFGKLEQKLTTINESVLIFQEMLTNKLCKMDKKLDEIQAANGSQRTPEEPDKFDLTSDEDKDRKINERSPKLTKISRIASSRRKNDI